MRMCKCGKANQPTRKFCIRCGEPLIGQEKDEKPAAPAPTPAPAPAEVAPPEESSYKPVGSPDKFSPTTNDQWVRPSQVDSDRVRSAERHTDKTELEKAQEAFEKAEDEDIDGRMLRASELKELMAEGPAEIYTEEEPAAPPAATPPVATPPTAAPPAATPPAATPPTAAPPAATPPAATPPTAAPPAATPPVATPPAAAPPAKPPATIPKPQVAAKSIETKVDARPAQPSVSGDDLDPRIQQVDSDLAEFNIKLQALQAELEDIRSKNEGNVTWVNTVAEQKRIKLEEAEEDLRRAKEEFSNASKDLQNAEKRMKKEVSDAEKRVSDIEKRIDNAHKFREKRLKEIEKEKEKEAREN
ncbi:MAG: hypothetical protein ACFFF4_10795 [Candidatus Thorarchaeota archaeon]